MQAFVYLRPSTLPQAVQMAREHSDGLPLAGGQSLLSAMKLGLNAPTHLIDLQDVPGLQEIRVDADTLHVGAMVSHARIARSAEVQAFCPMLAALAGGIADEQVRTVGTIGGALANNDPAACWPAGVLALNATLVTHLREIPADAFFRGLYATALQPGELLLAVRFPRALAAGYQKQEQPASRFALVGVAVARVPAGGTSAVRVALTGLGQGVLRWTAAERALSAHWSVDALADMDLSGLDALGDVHASAAYRAHLARVVCRRVVSRLTGEPLVRGVPRPLPQHPPASRVPAAPESAAPGTLLVGTHLLHLPLTRVWEGLLDPAILRICIPGCESLHARGEHRYDATVKVGIGPVSARFMTHINLSGLQPPGTAASAACRLQFEGQAGGLGHGQGTAQVTLAAIGPDTRLDWQARTQVSGRMAQLGNRLIEATARKLSEDFFTRFAAAVGHTEGMAPPALPASHPPPSPLQRLVARLEHFLRTLFRR